MSATKKLTKITDKQVAENGVQALANKPNSPTQYGVGGLNSTSLKLWFDKLAILIKNKINEISDILSGDESTKYIRVLLDSLGIEKVHTFSERISEWFSSNFLEFIGTTDVVGTAVCLAMIILEKMANKKHKIDIKNKLIGNTAIIEASNTVNNKVIEVVNQLIEKQNLLEVKEADRDKLLADVMTFNKAIIEILMSVYANNKNIPQAIKDLINIKYVQALKKENLIEDTTPIEEKQEIVEE